MRKVIRGLLEKKWRTCAMETRFAPFSRPECQICFDPFGARRRPKLLACRHTCCSVCLGQMVLNHGEIRCPWCRQITSLGGLSVFRLPDDPRVLSAIAATHAPIFIGLSDGGYVYEFKNAEEEEARVEGTDRGREGEEGRETATKSSGWTGFCTILLVVVILIFLLAIILHNMSCVSKRFSLISCG